MTEQEARELERHWGAPGPAPDPDWRLCYRCGEWWPRNPRFWCMPHRLCRACKNGERVGVWPYTRRWHRVYRWDRCGQLLRRCRVCRKWKPLAEFGLVRSKYATRPYPHSRCIACHRIVVARRKRRLE